jgi:hypothetical protein
MSGHRPFANLTKDFTPERRARIAAKAAILKKSPPPEGLHNEEVSDPPPPGEHRNL